MLNCIGPFYHYGPLMLEAAISAGVNYVDICDDLDATQAQLALDGEAQAAGISALIGMGNSRGLANLLARFCADQMLDEVEAVDIYHIHGGEFRMVRMLADSGRAYYEETDFKGVGVYPVFPYPHPETITLPRYLAGVQHVTNKGSVLRKPYFQLTMDLVKDGLGVEEPVAVQGNPVVPLEFAVAFILARRPAFLAEAGVAEATGCLKVQVRGHKDGKQHTYICSMVSSGSGAGEGTGIPAALGAMLMLQGRIERKGVVPPEAVIDPMEVFGLAAGVVKHFGMGDGVPLFVEHIDAEGNLESLEIDL